MTLQKGMTSTWDEARHTLDDSATYNTIVGTPYYRDAGYEHFSKREYARRYEALREKMEALGLECVIVPGGPGRTFGEGMLWLTGHLSHNPTSYAVVPLKGEPTMLYGMGGTHAEVVRRETAQALDDVRTTPNGNFGEALANVIREKGLDRSRIGLLELPRYGDYYPVNQYESLRGSLPEAELVLTRGIMHELLSVHSEEELSCIRTAGQLCQRAMEAIVDRAAPGVTDRDLYAAAGAAILEGGGDIDLIILASTPMASPSMVFGNQHPAGRVLSDGTLIVMELGAGYRGYTAQLGSPVCIGQPPKEIRQFWDEIVYPGFVGMAKCIRPGHSLEEVREAAGYFRAHGAQSRPIVLHGIDLWTSGPRVFTDHVQAEPFEEVMRPGMVLMLEPDAITADGMLGMFLGHTFIVTDEGQERVDNFPLELTVTG